MNTKAKQFSGQHCLYFLNGAFVGITYSPESTYILEPRADEYTFVPVGCAAAANELLSELEKSANVISHCISEMPEAYREAMRTQVKSARTAIISAASERVLG
mgnify:CR=1 FL=1